MVQQKHAADIENTKAQAAERNSNVGKNIQQGVGYGLDNSGKLLAAADKALMYAAQSGDPMAAKLALNNAYKAGSITPELYQQYSNQIDVLGNNPDELKNFAGNLIFAGAKDPASLLYQDANNAATNATAQRGQDISADTSRYGTDVSANTAAARLAQDGQQFGATMEFKKSQTSPLFAVQQKDIADGKAKLVDVNGVTYLDYGDGNGEIYVDKGGQPAKAQAKAAKGISKLSDKALIQVNEANTQLLQANQNYNKIGGLVNDLKDGKLNLSASSIAGANARSAIGITNANDLAVIRFQTVINQSANDVLMMAKGTQTEGDAKRAVETLTAKPPRDNNAAMQTLNSLVAIQRNIIDTLNGNIDTIYDNWDC